MSDDSVTGWFHALRDGNEQAAGQLWNRYFQKVASVIRKQVYADAAYDEEDVAVSVFDALFRGVKDGRYEDLASRDELWGLMLVITRRKMIDRARRSSAERRVPRGASSSPQRILDVDQLPDESDDPGWSLLIEDEYRRLFDILDNERYQSVALLKLDGLPRQEIAAQLQLSESTVQRTVALVRKRWELELGS